MLRNNHTVVIGGLLADQDEGTEIKVPFLGDIPLIGRAFKRKTANQEKLELLIFLTARIIEEQDFEPAEIGMRYEQREESPKKPNVRTITRLPDTRTRLAPKVGTPIIEAERPAPTAPAPVLKETAPETREANQQLELMIAPAPKQSRQQKIEAQIRRIERAIAEVDIAISNQQLENTPVRLAQTSPAPEISASTADDALKSLYQQRLTTLQP